VKDDYDTRQAVIDTTPQLSGGAIDEDAKQALATDRRHAPWTRVVNMAKQF
jgi:hypothetical protein